jgi:hypothetical protein
MELKGPQVFKVYKVNPSKAPKEHLVLKELPEYKALLDSKEQ